MITNAESKDILSGVCQILFLPNFYLIYLQLKFIMAVLRYLQSDWISHVKNDFCFGCQNGQGIPAVLASVIINSSDLLRVDLTGIHVILPRLLSALEDLQQKFKLVVYYCLVLSFFLLCHVLSGLHIAY